LWQKKKEVFLQVCGAEHLTILSTGIVLKVVLAVTHTVIISSQSKAEHHRAATCVFQERSSGTSILFSRVPELHHQWSK